MEIQNYPVCPVKDCKLPVDIVLQSSDGVFFLAHMKNLEQYSEGFPQAGSIEVDPDIPMLENAQVIELMLQFMHHTRQPELTNLKFDLLSALAEAVEKYMIYSAMSVCKVLMGDAIASHPIDVLVYAFKHGYSDLANKAAPLTLSMDSEDIVKRAETAHLHDSFLVAWFRYRDARAKIGRSLLTNPPGYGISGSHKCKRPKCKMWVEFMNGVVSDGAKLAFPEPNAIAQIMSAHFSPLRDCYHCSTRAGRWQYAAQKSAAEEAPLFIKA